MKFGKNGSNIIKKEFDSNPVYNEKYIKAKMKSYNGKTNTNFHNNRIPKEDSQCIFLSITLIDSVYKEDKNYYPQVLFGVCKYFAKKRRNLISLLTT